MNRCPYLVDVTADWLCLYPRGVFCRQPDGRTRIPGATTVARRCSGNAYEDCYGYRTFADDIHDEGDHDGG